MPNTTGGPWVSMASFCEVVLQEANGLISPVRLIDQLTMGAVGPQAAPQMPPVLFDKWLVITLKSGAARGRHTVTVRPEAPSGQQLEPSQLPVHFDGEERGQGLILQMNIVLEEEGVYWFDVILDDEQLLTRVPLKTVYQPATLSAGG